VHELLHRVGITTVFVTHDQDEAFVLGDEVAVMRDGEIVQQARPESLYADPATAWVARFVGDANLVPGTASGSRAETALGSIPLRRALTGAVKVLLRPEDLRLTSEEGNASVALVEYYGHDTVYEVVLSDDTRVRVREVASPRFVRDDRVQVFARGSAVPAFPATSGSDDRPVHKPLG
jgi:iron(III) transport system ATP-binding protein